jgi:hypothetical protein
MNLSEAYLKAIQAVGRPRRDLRPVFPKGWKESERAVAMLVLAGGRSFKSGDWPAVAFILGRGTYALGNSIPGAAFPPNPDLPRVFEGHQCFLEVEDDVTLIRDVSTNGTYVISPAKGSAAPSASENDKAPDEEPASVPRTIHSNDVLVTVYAELLLVRL